MSLSTGDLQQNQIVNLERHRKPRKKHKNSKLGCVQCKERRMKCDEELPQCRNCRIRQVKIPCSYLSFTEEEKDNFIEEKKKQKALANSASPSSPTSNSSTSSPAKVSKSSNSDVNKVKLIRHEVPLILKSQLIKNFGEPESSFQGRVFYTKLINKSHLNYDESFNTHFCFVSYWLLMQLKRKYENIQYLNSNINESDINFLKDFTYKNKSKCLIHLRQIVLKVIEAQDQKDYKQALKLYSEITMPTICLESLDLLSKSSLKSYYIDGSLNVLKELNSNTTDSSPFATFVLQSLEHTIAALFVPSYNFDVLFEVFEVLKDYQIHIDQANDELLTLHYEDLIEFVESYLINSDVRFQINKEYVTDYPAGLIYEIYFNFNRILPSEVFSINSMISHIHKIFYSFYYMLARVLDSIFPEIRYLSQHRFIGPTTLYPFTKDDLISQIPNKKLIFFASYSLRLTSFFTRRTDFFNKFMKILNPFPRELPKNRFQSRKTKKIKEIQIINFTNTTIRQWHYPSVEKETQYPFDNNSSIGLNEDSPSSSGSFSTNFSALISVDNVSDDLTNFEFDDHKFINEQVNFEEIADSGLLIQDHDPYFKEWSGFETANLHKANISIMNNLEDRVKLMNEFSRKSA